MTRLAVNWTFYGPCRLVETFSEVYEDFASDDGKDTIEELYDNRDELFQNLVKM